MRRTAICLMLLLLSATSAAAIARNPPGENEPCIGNGTDSATQASAPATTAKPAAASKESHPGARSSGGDSDMGIPRARSPKWHSFLPGMFR